MENRNLTAILLASFGPLNEAVALCQDAHDRNRKVLFVAFKPEWAEVLSPLLGPKTSLEIISREMVWSLKYPNKSIFDLCRILQKSWQLEALLKNQEVILFGASIVVPSVIIGGRLSLVSTAYYTPKHEGRGESWSHLTMPDKSALRHVKAKLLSILTGLEIEVRRSWSPVYTLSDGFLNRHTTPLPAPASQPVDLMSRLQRDIPAKCMLMFTDYPMIWPTQPGEAQQFYSVWEAVCQMVGDKFHNHSIYVKAHPKTPNLPRCFCKFQVIDSGLPMELFRLPMLNVVIFDASGAAKPFLAQNDIVSISVIELFQAGWKERLRGFLKENVDPKAQARAPRTENDFAACLPTSDRDTDSAG